MDSSSKKGSEADPRSDEKNVLYKAWNIGLKAIRCPQSLKGAFDKASSMHYSYAVFHEYYYYYALCHEYS